MPTTYYLSNEGKDCNAGTSPSSPWQTFSKLTQITLQPGDTICFRCGDTWNDTLHLSSNDTPGAPITWTSYSENNNKSLPVISGFQEIAGSAWSSNGDIRSATVPGDLGQFNVVTFGTTAAPGGNQPIGRYPAVGSTAGTWNRTVNVLLITTGAAALFTAYDHGMAAGDTVTFTTTGTLPAPLQPAPVKYYVVSPAKDTFQLAATPSGTPISTTGTYTGNVTAATPGKSNYNMVSAVKSFIFTSVINDASLHAAAIPAGFTAGTTAVALYSKGVLPKKLDTGSTFYVVSIDTSNNTFQLSEAPGGVPVVPTTAVTDEMTLIWGITDDALNAATGAVDFAGGEIVIRKASWILDRGQLTGSTLSENLNYASDDIANTYKPKAGWGYFIQNHPGCLNALGDWCHRPSANLFSMYFGSDTPAEYTVKVPNQANNVVIPAGISNHTFIGIHFEGANQYSISGVGGSSNIGFINCVFSHIGQDAINFADDINSTVSEINISNCTFTNIANNGINLRGPNNCQITNCTFDKIHDIAGMGRSGDGNGYAILLATPDPAVTYNNVIIGNTFSNCGYVPLGYTGGSCLIAQNYIDRYCYTKDDGGGIYGGSDRLHAYIQRRIINNIVFNGIGAAAGKLNAGPAAHGIYTDDYSTDIYILNNTVAHMQGSGLMVHNSDNINIQGNLFYDCMLNNFEPSGQGIIHMVSDPLKASSGTLQNIIFRGNIIWSTRSQPYLFVNINKDDTVKPSISCDYNFYHSPLALDQFFFLKQPFYSAVAQRKVYNLRTWGASFGRDISSRDKMPSGFNYKYTLTIPAKVTQAFFDSNGNIAPSGPPGTIRTQSNCDFSRDDVKLGAAGLTITPHDPDQLAVVYINMGDTTGDNNPQYFITFNIVGIKDSFLLLDIDKTYKLGFARINAVETQTAATANVCIMKNNATSTDQFLQITIPVGTGPVTINNLRVYTGSLVPPDTSKLRFEYNATTSPLTLILEKDSYDAAYNFYPAGDLILKPFTSVLLVPVVM